MRRILVTNDDGIQTEGLLRLAQAAEKFGEVWIVAPDGQRSAVGQGLTLYQPLDVFPCSFPLEEIRAYTCSGTPADCVRVACQYLMPDKPDAVLSGINLGVNVAAEIHYSATLGAAFEGSAQGCLSAALSEESSEDHAVTDAYLQPVLEEIFSGSLPRHQVYNVNFPACPPAACRGILRNCRVESGLIYEDYFVEKEKLPGGGVRLFVAGNSRREAQEETDYRAILDRYISFGIVQNIRER